MNFKFSTRDLINAGIFAALYLVILFGMGAVASINPLAMFITSPTMVFLNGVVFMLYLTRVKHAGMVLLFGILVSLIMVVGHVWTIPIMLVVAGAAELIIWSGNYRSINKGILAYGVFSLWLIAPWVPVFYMAKEHFQALNVRLQNPEYVSRLEEIFTPTTIIMFISVLFIFALLGGWLGKVMLRKHFERAGIA